MTELSRTLKAWHVVARDTDRWIVRGWVADFCYFFDSVQHLRRLLGLWYWVFLACLLFVFLRISTGQDSEFQFVRARIGSGQGGFRG